MPDMLQDPAPSLFDAPPPASYLHAKEFVRWCCSFGSDFRNSPDVTNLRYWASKNGIRVQDGEEAEVLDIARSMFLKRIREAVSRAARAEIAEPN
jgi:hypothetical protein